MMTVNQVLADNRTMERFICDRIRTERTRIVLASGWRPDGPAWVDLTLFLCDDGDHELVIESNEPEAFRLRDVYEHFRSQEMTGWEWEREIQGEMNRWKVHDLERVIAVLGQEPRNILLSSEKFLSAQDIVAYYQGKICLRLAYQIMDECEPVRAGKKRLVTAQSFEAYLRGDQAEEQAPKDDVPKINEPANPPISPKRGKSHPDVEFEFFRFQH